MPLLSIIEENSREKIAQAVLKGLDPDNYSGSFLCMSADDAKFATCLANLMESDTFIYATDCEANLENAENEGVVTTLECDFTDAKLLKDLGKYDGVVVKDVLEHQFLNIGDFMESLWRILKLNGNAVVMLRASPPFPMPEAMSDVWAKSVPDLEVMLNEAKNEDFAFEPDVQEVACHVTIQKDALTDLLYSFPSYTELDVKVALENADDTVVFEDIITLVCLKKIID